MPPHAELVRRVRASGLLDPAPGAHGLYALGTLTLLAFGAGAIWAAEGLGWALAGAVVLALGFVQVAYLAHDLGHQRILSSPGGHRLLGAVYTLLVGVSFQWWVAKHNQHHRAPNRFGTDPDLDIAFVAFTVEQLSAKSGIERRLARRQHLLFGVLLLLTPASMRLASAEAILRGRTRAPTLEAALLLGHVLGLLVLFFGALEPGPALLALAVNQAVFGLHLGLVFAPNHIGMPLRAASPPLDALADQVLSSRNLAGGLLVDLVFGGLNRQIEHHLFPTMPRHRLRRARGLVKPYCEARGIAYSEVGVLAAYAHVGRTLRRVAKEEYHA
jgi:fatty acid desaturase